MTRRHSRSRRSKETPGWMWMLLGLTMGLVVAGYVYVSDVRPPGTAAREAASPASSSSASSSSAAADSSAAAKTPEPRRQASSTARTEPPAPAQTATRAATAQSPAAEPPAARASATAQSAAAQAPPVEASGTRFQFYEDLPQSEVVVHEPSASRPPARSATAAASTPTQSPAPAAIQEPGSYMLQVGSFRTHADADRRKASIALLGYESQIQQATVNGDLVHRVLVGPINDLAALDAARRRFHDQNFDTLVLKAAK